MKYFALGLLVILVQPTPPLPRQTVNEQAKKTTSKPNVSDNRQSATDPLPPNIVINNCANQNEHTNARQNDTANEHPDSQKQPQPWSRNDKLTLAYDLLTGLLVVIALGTGLAVIRQAVETAKATKAMRDSLDVQMAGLEQWVDIETRSAAISESSRVKEIDLHFKAINNTDYPLTVVKIVTVVSYWANKWDKSTVETNITLPPSKKDDRPYFFYAKFKPTDADIEHFQKGTIFTINGELTYRDCLGRIRIQNFGGLYGASPEKFEWLEPYGTVPRHERHRAVGDSVYEDFLGTKENKDDNPN